MANKTKINKYIQRGRNLFKRQTRTTYDNRVLVSGFSRNVTNPYSNETTWLALYSKEPFIRGAIDALVNAVVGEWTIESTKLKPTPKDEKLRLQIINDLSDPKTKLRTKLATMTTKLIIDSVFVIETANKEGFYILNKEDWTVEWNEENTKIESIAWSAKNKKDILEIGEFVIGSVFDPDTNLWQNSPLETLIDMGNLLYHARQYNLKIFQQGGIPSMLYTLPEGTTPESKADFVRTVKNLKSGENLVGIGDVKAQPIAGFTKDMEYNILVDHAVQSIMTLIGVSPLMMNLAVKQGSGGGGEGTRQEMNAFATRVHTLQKIDNDAMTEVVHFVYGDDPTNQEEEDSTVRVGRKKEDPVRFMRFKLRKWVDSRQQAATHKIYLDTGVINANEARNEIGKEDREGGDEYFDVNNRQAGGNTGAENPSGQDRDPNQEDDSNEGSNQNDGNRVDDK